MYWISAISSLLPFRPSSSFVSTRRCYPRRATLYSRRINLKPLTSRLVLLTRHRQLGQIVEEVEAAKIRYGRLNTIVMNSVLEACVHCGNIDLALRMFHEMAEPGGIGVDSISYATILKGLGKARRIDEAFQMLESIEQGTAAWNPKLSSSLIYGLLDALINAVQEIYVVPMVCLAMKFFKDMKDKAEEYYDDFLQPDVVTYTTLVKGEPAICGSSYISNLYAGRCLVLFVDEFFQHLLAASFDWYMSMLSFGPLH